MIDLVLALALFGLGILLGVIFGLAIAVSSTKETETTTPPIINIVWIGDQSHIGELGHGHWRWAL